MTHIKYSSATQLSAILTIICLIIAFTMATIVLIKAIQLKEKRLYYFFITLICLFSIWYVPAFGYLYWLVTNEAVSYELHLIGYNAIYPFGILAWLVIYTSTILTKYRKTILGLFLISIVFLEIYLFYYLYFAPNAPVIEMLGEVNELKSSNHGLLIIFGIIYILIGVITGIHFSIHTIKVSEKPENILKGKFILIAFILFGIQITIEAIAAPTDVLLVIINRSLLILTIIFWYLGFLLPSWVKKRLLKS